MVEWKQITNRKSLTPYGMSLCLSFLVIALAVQNYRLKSELAHLSHPEYDRLRPGDEVASIPLISLGGDTIHLDYRELNGNQVICILSAECPHCLRNLRQWAKLADSCKYGGGGNAIGICLNDRSTARRLAQEYDIGFYLAIPGDSAFLHVYKVSVVPETVLIDRRGIVRDIWMGELSDSCVQVIARHVRIQAALYN